MWRSLVEVAACIHCGGALSVEDGRSDAYLESGVLTCADCDRRFEVREGIAHFGEADDLHNCADRWREGVLTDELLAGNIHNLRRLTAQSPALARCVDAAAERGGFIVDVATGPGSGMCGALAARLPDGAHLILTDASAELMRGLKRCWDAVPSDARIDFWLFDANRMPLRDGSVDCFTSAGGFHNVRGDRRGGQPSPGEAYREAARALKPGGLLIDTVRGMRRSPGRRRTWPSTEASTRHARRLRSSGEP